MPARLNRKERIDPEYWEARLRRMGLSMERGHNPRWLWYTGLPMDVMLPHSAECLGLIYEYGTVNFQDLWDEGHEAKTGYM